MTIYLSLAVCLIGALMYGFASNPKVAEIGRISFAFGLLAFLMNSGQAMSILR